MSAAAIARPYAAPRTGGSGRAIALAVLMHLLLGGLLFFGIRWQSSEPAVVQAELWSAVPQTAAPAPVPMPPPPKVEPPKPVPQPEPEPEPPKKADIVEKAPPKVEPPKKKELPKVEPPKVEPPKVQPKPVPPVPKVDPKPTVNKELLKLQQQAAVEAPQRPPSDVSALLAAAGKESNGQDAQTSGPRGRDTYIGRLQAAIRSQMRYPASSTGNPTAKMHVDQLPNGEVTNVKVLRSSGILAFDEAIERAIRAASPLPRDERGKVERELEFDYRMYERP